MLGIKISMQEQNRRVWKEMYLKLGYVSSSSTLKCENRKQTQHRSFYVDQKVLRNDHIAKELNYRIAKHFIW